MFITETTLDDALFALLSGILKNGVPISSTKGENLELTGVYVEITNPRARLSRTESRGKPFSCLGELLWYLAGSDRLEFIQYYIPDYQNYVEEDGSIHGGYGPRIFPQNGLNQFENVRRLLCRKPSTRQAVIQIFSGSDIAAQKKDTPCTCTLQFLNRDNKLHLIACMRSNDAFLGFPHDVFSFTMLQEIMATSLGLDVGTYKHFAGSMHIYDDKRRSAQRFIDEGYQSTLNPMPPMPYENQMEAIKILLPFEAAVRTGNKTSIDLPNSLLLAEFWQDIARLLLVYRCHKDADLDRMIALKQRFRSEVYHDFVDRKIDSLRRRHAIDTTGEIPNTRGEPDA